MQTPTNGDTALPFLNLPEEGNPDDNDACYSLALLPAGTVADVYLTLNGLPRGLHLKSLSDSTPVCLNEVIALENVKKYQITVALQTVATKAFHLVVKKTSSKQLKVSDLIKADGTTGDLTNSWYYYSSLANYEIHSSIQVEASAIKVTPTHAIEACDISANCVPLVESATDAPLVAGSPAKKILSYTIDEPSKKIFAKSPLIRFKGDLTGLAFTQK